VCVKFAGNLFVVYLPSADICTNRVALSHPGPVWTAPFNQTITIYVKKWFNQVQWYYDSTTKPVGSSLYEHGKGQYDEWCTSVVGHETSDAPCNLLASTDGWRRIIYPETGECCKACNVTEYCGIVAPWWLQQNATFQGYKTIAGMNCSGWMKQGGEENYYYSEVTTQQPCQYYEGYPTLPCESCLGTSKLVFYNKRRVSFSYASFGLFSHEQLLELCCQRIQVSRALYRLIWCFGTGSNVLSASPISLATVATPYLHQCSLFPRAAATCAHLRRSQRSSVGRIVSSLRQAPIKRRKELFAICRWGDRVPGSSQSSN
jgi:hypothetical protein